MDAGAGSWKPSSPMMAAVESESAARAQTPAAQRPTDSRLQNVLQAGNSTPYWSPSTHTNESGGQQPMGSVVLAEEGTDAKLGYSAPEFIPGGASKFMPGQNLQHLDSGTVLGNNNTVKDAGGAGISAGTGAHEGSVDPRMYDQIISQQGGATYSEAELIKPSPRRRTLGSFFMSDRLLDRCQHLNECMMRQLEPGDERMKLIPSGYTSIFPLDAPGQDDSSSAGSFGYP